MKTEVTINGALYALAQIGDHVEAWAAYTALAALYPEFEASIQARYTLDQSDWGFPGDWDAAVEAEKNRHIPEYLAKGGVL